jgi:Domain of unknown function (DUF4395)
VKSPSDLERNFILQQGFAEPAPEVCSREYSALLFQPRLVTLAVLLGVVLQEPVVFVVLAAVLWWSAAFPRWNPFDALYNSMRPTGPGLTPAPGPRRFAQFLAGSFALAIAVSLRLGWKTGAIVLQALLLAAVAALAFGGFCLGSFLFHLLRGNVAFALRTLPWVRAGQRR